MTNQNQPANQPAGVSYEDILNKDILELMGAKDMPEDRKQNLYLKMLETIQNRAIARIADRLAPEDLTKFRELAQSQNKAELNSFLAEKQIDLNQLFLNETLLYKSELTELAKPLKQAVDRSD